MGGNLSEPPPIRNALGAGLLAFSWVFFTAEMILARILSEDLPISEIAVFRLGTQIIVLVPVFAYFGVGMLKTTRIWLHISRAGFSASGTVLFYLTFALLPVAVATTLTFTQALFITIMAAVLLREYVGPRRVIAIIVGFIGVLIVIRPGFVEFDPKIFVALAAALAASALMIVTRSLGQTEHRFAIMAYSAGFGFCFLLPYALVYWKPVDDDLWPMIIVLSLCGTIGQFLMIGAYKMAEASALAPIDYVRLVYAVVAGYVIFSEVPDFWTYVGSAVIILSALYTSHREQVLARRRANGGSDE
jgi:drug/metabolite transporter (DMT)-like permease